MSKKYLLAIFIAASVVSLLFAFLGIRAASGPWSKTDIAAVEKVYEKSNTEGNPLDEVRQTESDYIMTATAYVDRGETKSRIHAGVGCVAVDPKVITHGTLLFIEGYGLGLATDTGRLIKGQRIDVWFPDEEMAIKWGRKKVRVWKVGQADIKKILATGGQYIKY
ncbi:3D domain-containing protein [Phosphitispora sp. TUW77]|uniref:3D domain-containing protein n=1 Tax=Phosphitispora sp. TUW77 TaxID=3152361 RepID=UPI003AB21519